MNLPDGNLATELVHIHSGQCGDTLGGAVHALTNFENGSGASVTMVEAALSSVMTGGFAINSHESGNPSVYTSCGNIPALADSISLSLAELNDEGQLGLATLTARGSQTEVVLAATADLSELNHIHLGSCSDLGGVEFGLTNMAGGTSVTTVDATLASLRTGGFAVNLHKTGDLSTYTSCGNIPGETVTVALAELNGSGQTGTATLTAANGQTQVVLSATADISELNHIHLGSCDNLGGVAHGLTNMADGASVTTVDASLASLRNEGFAVNLHMIGDPSTYTSCGDIPGESVTVTLSGLNDSGQSGSATLTAVSGKTQVVISATDGLSDLNHIHTGTCGDNLGGVAHSLTNLADGTSVTTVDASLDSLRTGDFAINLHQNGDPSVYTSCGNIAGTPISVPLAELNASGQTGTATLTVQGAQTQVVLSATDGISNLNHIHTGTCGDGLGGVAHALTDLTSGASVNTVDATLDSLRSGGFAVNLHQIGDASLYTSCGNIPASSGTLTLAAAKDSTIFDTASGATSNGAGKHLFAGSSNAGIAHRALVSFDLSAIPAGATITSVELTLNMSRTTAGDVDVGLHRITTDWGEGASAATGEEGRGADALAGDATWSRAKFDTDSWQTPGGDFQAAASATMTVGGLGQYTWESTSQLVSDVQGWVDGSGNFGWMLLAADEATRTAKRFDSRENAAEGNRPALTIVYTTS